MPGEPPGSSDPLDPAGLVAEGLSNREIAGRGSIVHRINRITRINHDLSPVSVS